MGKQDNPADKELLDMDITGRLDMDSVDRFEKGIVDNSINSSSQILGELKMINLEKAFEQYKASIRQSVLTKDGAVSQLADDKLRGLVAEAHFKGSTLIDAAAKGIDPNRVQGFTGGDILPDGTPLLKNDEVTDVAFSIKDDLLQQLGLKKPTIHKIQVKFYKSSADTRRALANEKYSDVHKLGPSDQTAEFSQQQMKVGGKTVQNDPLSDPDSYHLTKQAKVNRADYANKQDRINQLQKHNLQTAVKSGAVIGALSAAITELVDIAKHQKELTAEQFIQSTVRVLQGTADGAARSGVIYGAVQLVGASGAQAVPVMAAANTLYDFAKDFHRFCMGKIDADDLLCNTVNNSFRSGASFTGGFVGAKAAIALGATIGTPAGPIGTAVGALIGGLVFGLGSNYVITSAQKEGMERFQQSLQAAMTSTSLDSRMVQLDLIHEMGSLSQRDFSLKSLIPMHNLISDLTEYNQKKKVLRNMENQISVQQAGIELNFLLTQRKMKEQYERRCKELEFQFRAAREELFASYESTLDNYIQVSYRDYLKSYQVAFGNLALEYNNLQAQEEAHQSQMEAVKLRTDATNHLLHLLNELRTEDADFPKTVGYLVNQLIKNIQNDEMLTDKMYIHRQDVKLLLAGEGETL